MTGIKLSSQSAMKRKNKKNKPPLNYTSIFGVYVRLVFWGNLSPDPTANTKTHTHIQGLGREAAKGMDRNNISVYFLAPGELWSCGVLGCSAPQLGSCCFPGLARVIFIPATGLRWLPPPPLCMLASYRLCWLATSVFHFINAKWKL